MNDKDYIIKKLEAIIALQLQTIEKQDRELRKIKYPLLYLTEEKAHSPSGVRSEQHYPESD
jgi:hypothetical protein